MKRSYVVSRAASADLREITKYTLKAWGEAQCRTYIAALERSAEAVAKGEGIFKDMSWLIPDLRMVTSGRHYIFCIPRAGKPALILAILHDQMDLMERLKERLR